MCIQNHVLLDCCSVTSYVMVVVVVVSHLSGADRVSG